MKGIVELKPSWVEYLKWAIVGVVGLYGSYLFMKFLVAAVFYYIVKSL